MTRGADQLPVSDHAVLRYLERICGVDVDAVRRRIFEAAESAVKHGARGIVVDGIVYRLQEGYVTTCFKGEPYRVQQQGRDAAKRILRKSRDVPILSED